MKANQTSTNLLESGWCFFLSQIKCFLILSKDCFRVEVALFSVSSESCLLSCGENVSSLCLDPLELDLQRLLAAL